LVVGPNRICPKTRLALVGPRVGVRLDRKEREWVTTSRVVLVALNRGVGEEAAPADPEAPNPAAAEAPPARPVSRKIPDVGFKPVYGLCPVCGWVRACRRDGTLREHKFSNDRGQQPGHSCPGIGQKPVNYVPRPEVIANSVNPTRQGG
jgi:hypothetical protein